MKYRYFVCYQVSEDQYIGTTLRTTYISIDYPLDSVPNVDRFKLWMESQAPKYSKYILVSFSLLNAEDDEDG